MSVAPTTAPQTLPSAADHRHEQVFDTLVEIEGRRIHEALQMCVEPTGNAREERCIDEHHDLEPRAVDAEGFRHVQLPAQRPDRPPRPRIEQVRSGPEGHDRDAPDQEVVIPLVLELESEEIESRDAGQSGVTAKELKVPHQEINAGAPGDRRQRQIVTLHPQRNEAEAQRERQRQHQANREVRPWRPAVARREDCRRIGADADERCLAERRLTRHARQENETQRDDAVEPNVVAERDPELRREKRTPIRIAANAAYPHAASEILRTALIRTRPRDGATSGCATAAPE
jgi:hypothetical protein